MHIIFGDAADVVADKYTVLELDTIRVDDQRRIRTFCLVTQTPLSEFPLLENFKKIHADLITGYRAKNWDFCELAIQSLKGKFNGELDSFYEDLASRVEQYKLQTLPNEWDWAIVAKKSE